jgi:diguanylate cyclase (GGDEF)-like protein
MTADLSSLEPDKRQVERPAPSSEDLASDLRRLGEATLARCPEVLATTVARTVKSGQLVGPSVQRSFEEVCTASTTAVARWIAGDGLEVTHDAASATSRIFGELAAHRAATMHEVTRRSLWWRNVMADMLRKCAADLQVSDDSLKEALNMLQLSLEFSLLGVCECFEKERERTDEELARREDELSFLATHDALTGLPNRTLILDRAAQMLARGARNGTPVTALFIDLDNFKTINDTLGHDTGDQLLQAVAGRLDTVVRGVDALGRLGGDEFVVIVEDVPLGDVPELVAERLLDALAQPFRLGPREQTTVSVTASIGIAAGEGLSAAELLRDADIAMYRAKRDGRKGFAVYETAMKDTLQDRMKLESDLQAALQKGEFKLAYQPTLDLASMRPTGVEALVRWHSPDRGLVQPDAFIGVLEETGLILELGRWVLMRACCQAAQWRAAGHPIMMAVNVSGRQLDSDQLVTDIDTALQESGLEPTGLTIEITETILMKDTEETARRLTAIKDRGVRIAIDDFGTGYSSLAHLQRFPVDALKIDRSFISGLKHNKQGETLIHALVQLGKALSIETFAEGIEEQQDLSFLRQESCDSGQGFLFAMPLDPEAALEFFATWVSGQPAAGTARTDPR